MSTMPLAHTTVEELRAEAKAQKVLMIKVSRWDATIDDVNDEYETRRRRIRGLVKQLGLNDPNPHPDLWSWWAECKSGLLPSYADRRGRVADMYAELEEALDHIEGRKLGGGLQDHMTGWPKVDNQLGQLRARYATAQSTEDYQAIGLLCRDIMLSLAEATFDTDKHLPSEALAPESLADQLEMVIDAEAQGSSNKDLRQVVRANLGMANHVQHDRVAMLDDAATIAEATIALVNLTRILMFGATRSD